MHIPPGYLPLNPLDVHSLEGLDVGGVIRCKDLGLWITTWRKAGATHSPTRNTHFCTSLEKETDLHHLVLLHGFVCLLVTAASIALAIALFFQRTVWIRLVAFKNFFKTASQVASTVIYVGTQTMMSRLLGSCSFVGVNGWDWKAWISLLLLFFFLCFNFVKCCGAVLQTPYKLSLDVRVYVDLFY